MFQTASTIESVSTRADNTIKVVVGTQELLPDQAAQLFALKGKIGWMLFKENAIEKEDLPEEPAPEFKSDRTPSQRLRAVVYKLWELNTNRSQDFNTYYASQIEKIINKIKEQLD